MLENSNGKLQKVKSFFTLLPIKSAGNEMEIISINSIFVEKKAQKILKRNILHKKDLKEY